MPLVQPKPVARRPKTSRRARQFLEQAFASFTQAAGSLEHSYGQLQGELARLRAELEEKNRDLTRMLAENERMRGELKRVLQGLPCGVLVTDPQGRLCMANPEARRLLGLGPASAGKKSLPASPSLRQLLAQVPLDRPGGERTCSIEGSEGFRHLAVTQASLARSQATPAEVVLILRDITEEKRLEAEREAAQRLQALAEVAMLLAHEIRNPLASLELFAGLLADATEKQPEIRQWVEHLQAGLRTISATVNNVLQFHNRASPQTVSTNVGRLLRETVEFLRPLARQRGIRMELASGLGESEIPADPHQLQQVFLNLALNAFQALSPGGLLRITADGDQPEGAISIEFADTGPGISPEHQARIFEPGFTTRSGSPGLGLAVCRKIVEQHGGTIEAQSAPGEATTFRLRFPLHGADR